MWAQVIDFSSNLVHSIFSHAIKGKGLISLHFSPLSLKPNIV